MDHQIEVEDEKPRTLFIGNVPRETTKRDIENIFGDIGPLKRCYIQYPQNGNSEAEETRVAYVTFALSEDAAKALETLDDYKIGKNKLHLKFAKSRSDQFRASSLLKPPDYSSVNAIPVVPRDKPPRQKVINKKARLIIRNLSFQVTEEKIRDYFSTCGAIKDINILRKPNGKLVGCAFIQYENVPQAAIAMKELNMKEFLGRPIAVDWALPKKDFQAAANVTEKETEIKVEDIDGENSELVTTIKSEPLEEIDTKLDYPNQSKQLQNQNSSNPKLPNKRHWKHDSDASDDDEENKGKDIKRLRVKSNDVEEGATIFIRNLEFETTEEQLKTFFEQFGPVLYALLCKDRLTEHPKGTAFVKFKDTESVTKCFYQYNGEPSHFKLGRRQFSVSLAISKDKIVEKSQEATEKVDVDRRNLFLVREGFIRPGSEGALGVSVSDMNKRAALNQTKKQMLKNLSIFVSQTRLCVHNLSPTFSDKDLKKLFSKHAGKGSKITEARIMRDLKQIEVDGKGASKNYGFVSFSDHEHALRALRAINNNPDIFNPNKRPIVEFSLENRTALKAKERRTEKSKEKNQNKQQSEIKPKDDEMNEKTGGKKRKEKKAKPLEDSVGEVVERTRAEKRKEKKAKRLEAESQDETKIETELPSYTGLKSKQGVSTLPSMKAKGKITRKSLKAGKQKKKQERRMREAKSKPKSSNNDKEDEMDKMVSRHRRTASEDVETTKSKKKWYQ